MENDKEEEEDIPDVNGKIAQINYKPIEAFSLKEFKQLEKAFDRPEEHIVLSVFPDAEVKYPDCWKTAPTRDNFVSVVETKEIRLIYRCNTFTCFATNSPRNIVMIWDPLEALAFRNTVAVNGYLPPHSVRMTTKEIYVGCYTDDFIVPPLEEEKLLIFLHPCYAPFTISKSLPDYKKCRVPDEEFNEIDFRENRDDTEENKDVTVDIVQKPPRLQKKNNWFGCLVQ